ncbi:MAG TPA: dephospho-CoA kinase [Allosphingosinicella sp.]|nr:dephospho-CoA kinase [Allosphingosinicella sp.]
MTLLVGLTGSIGMGKSTVAKMFAEEGVPVFDADAAVHRLQGPDGALVAEIEAHFPGTTGPEGVNRGALAERVLGEPEQLRRLEALIHPAVARARREFIAAHDGAPVILLDIPLLFEAGGVNEVDKVAVVSAASAVQRERVLARPGMTPEKFEKILARQLPDAEKRARADFVIPTDVSLEETRASVRRILACLNGQGDS